MPNPNDYSSPPPPAPVTPPTLPPDFSDIPQNPSSELQPQNRARLREPRLSRPKKTKVATMPSGQYVN